MKIQPRIVVLLALVFLISLAIMSTVMLRVVEPAFDQLDRGQADKNVRRVERAIANELSGLGQMVVDWGQWTETYNFVVDGAPQYLDDNLQPGSLINLGVTFMAFYDSAGRPVWVGGYDPETEEPLSFFHLADTVRMVPVLRAINAHAGTLSGLLVADDVHYLISAGAILDNDGNGPSHGTLIMGRAFDDAMLAALTARTEVTINMNRRQPVAAEGVASDARVAIAETEEVLTHRIAIPEITGRLGLELVIETPREAAHVGRNAVRIANILLIATALVTMAAIAIAINLLIARPVRQIIRAMREVGELADLDKRLGWSRSDEFGTLAQQFDHMLEQIAVARRALLDLTFKLGRSDLATGMFHNVRNAMSPLANQLRRAVSGLTLPDTDHVARALAELKNAGTEPERKARLLDFLGVAWDQGERVRQVARAELEAATGQMAAIERILNQQHESQEAPLAPESLTLAFLVNESLAFFGSGQLALANVAIDPALAGMPPVSVQRLPVIHVLYNVIANAIAAIEANGGTPGRVQIRAANDPGRGIVRLELIDNGIGVDVALLNEIFRPGYTTKPNKKGGEGLHWCANAMAANGGRIWAESEGIGRGMTIVMELPQADQPPGVTQGSEARQDG